MIHWQPVGRRAEAERGTPLLRAARAAGIDLVAVCGGVGLCEGCRVRLREGRLSPAGDREREVLGDAALAAGWRLACQATADGDATIEVPPESLTAPQRLQVEGEARPAAPDPAVTAVAVDVPPPAGGDLRSDFSRLSDALAGRGVRGARAALPVLADLPSTLRAGDWSVSVVLRGREIVTVQAPRRPLLGLAVDAGTTKLAAYLVDLDTGATVGATGRMNPQLALGEDVISRIAYAGDDAGRRQELQAAVTGAIGEMAAGLAAAAGVSPRDIVDAVLVGNTAMQHLATGLPVRQLGEAPYLAAVTAPLEVPARELGLPLAPGAHVYLPPVIAGYVGGDHVAMLTASFDACDQPERSAATRGTREAAASVFVDVGTNTEMTVSARGRLWCCSCASGPAFEGAHIEQGMRAAPGAIERVLILGDTVRIHTIGGERPVGICGSGILDAVAALWRAGLLDRHGAFRGSHPALEATGRGRAFVLAPAAAAGHGQDVTVTRGDVTEIQLAKAAIRAGLEVLLATASLGAGDIGRVVIAGAFGSYLDVNSAVAIGMLPAFPAARIEQVGNAAGAGARRLLVSVPARRAAEDLAGRIEYVELTTAPGFSDAFARAVGF